MNIPVANDPQYIYYTPPNNFIKIRGSIFAKDKIIKIESYYQEGHLPLPSPFKMSVKLDGESESAFYYKTKEEMDDDFRQICELLNLN